MSHRVEQLLIDTLIDGSRCNYSDIEWDYLIRQARASGLLSRLACVYQTHGLIEPPDYVIKHLDSANKYWQSQNRIMKWELYNLGKVFDKINLPLILLKGTAYAAAGFTAGYGRIFNDIDILIPKDRIQEVKEILKINGWFPEKLDSYDQKYYERWMHELPPMRHIKSGTVLDVHHNIMPETCDLCPNAELLLSEAIQISNSNYWRLAPTDMVIHSACHLFWGGEFENGFRDLSDIDLLVREFSENDSDFCKKLLERARELGLYEPVFYAIRYTERILHTPIPKNILEIINHGSTKSFKIKLMDFLFHRALMPVHPSCDDRWTLLARWLLYIRSHWLRMPIYLLIPHLLRKSMKSFKHDKRR